MADKVLLDVKETANLVSVTPGTLYLWARMGYLPSIKMGRVLRFRQTAILEWIRQKEAEYNRGPDKTAQERRDA